MTAFCEKSIFIWQTEAICGGDVQQIADQVVAAGFEAAHLHSIYLSTWANPLRVGLVAALLARGISVYGSAAVYGAGAATEGATAAKLVRDYALAGFVFDAEVGFDEKPARVQNTEALCRAYKAGTDRPGAWCYWCFPSLHYPDVLRKAMEYLEAAMPMVYWNHPTDDSPAYAERYLDKSYAQWQPYLQGKVYCPAGRAFNGSGLPGLITPAQVAAFDHRARELGAAGITWWDMQHAIKLPDIWQALCETPTFSGGVVIPPPEEEPVTNPIGLFTRKPGWTKVNPNFNFVAGAAQVVNTCEPNPEIKPIELEARAAKVPFLLWWDVLPWEYSAQQFGEKNWPNEASDYPFQQFVKILQARSYDAVVIGMTTALDRAGKAEDPGFLSFCGKTFMSRVEKWLKANRPLVPLIVATSNAFIVKYAPNMNNWVGNYPGLAVQATPIKEAFPFDGAKPNYLGNRTECEWWRYFEKINGDALLLFRGAAGYPADAAGMARWLNLDGGVTPPPPPPPPDDDTLAARVNALEVELAALKQQVTADADNYHQFRAIMAEHVHATGKPLI